MWYGKMTIELEKLCDQYCEQFGKEPEGYVDLEYGQNDYTKYIQDIKKAIKSNKELPLIS